MKKQENVSERHKSHGGLGFYTRESLKDMEAFENTHNNAYKSHGKFVQKYHDYDGVHGQTMLGEHFNRWESNMNGKAGKSKR